MRPTRHSVIKRDGEGRLHRSDTVTNGIPAPIRIVIADEQMPVRQNLRKFLEAERAVHILAEATNSSEALRLICQLQPDIVLLDLDLCRALETSLVPKPAARLIVMIDKLEKTCIVDAILRGAQAVVLKTAEPHVLLRTLRSVGNGQYWLESETIGILVETLRELSAKDNGSRSPRDYGLTPRELDIITRIASGCSNKEVSREFSISERTVKHHLTNIFDKVGVSTRLELALFAVNQQWTEESSSVAAS